MFLLDYIGRLFEDNDLPSCTLLGFEMHNDILCENVINVLDICLTLIFTITSLALLSRVIKFCLLLTSVIRYFLILKSYKYNKSDYNLNQFKELMKTLQENNQIKVVLNNLKKKSIKIIRNKIWNGKCCAIAKKYESQLLKYLTTKIKKVRPKLRSVYHKKIVEECEEIKINDVQFLFVNDKYLNGNDVSKNDLQINDSESDNKIIKQNIKIDNAKVNLESNGHNDKFQTEAYNNYLQDELSRIKGKNYIDTSNCYENTRLVEKFKIKSSCIRRIYLQLVMCSPLTVEYIPQRHQNRLRLINKSAISKKSCNTLKQHNEDNNRCTNNLPASEDNLSSSNMLDSKNSSVNFDLIKIRSLESGDTYNILTSESEKEELLNNDKVIISNTNEFKKSNVTIRLEGNKRRNLLKYLELITEERKRKMQNQEQVCNKSTILQNENFPHFDKLSSSLLVKTKPSKTRKVNNRSNMNQNKTLNNSVDKPVKLQRNVSNRRKVKDVFSEEVIVIKPKDMIVNSNDCETSSVKDEIVNNIVKLREDTVTSAMQRYIIHKSNKIRKSPSNNSLDVIQENISHHNVVDVIFEDEFD